MLKDGQLVGTVRPQEADQGQLIRMMVGRSLGEIFPSRRPPPGARLRWRSRTWPGTAPSRTSRSRCSRGEVLGMFGLVGSGRTQVARCIFGADPFDAGRGPARREADPPPLAPRGGSRQGIALLTEDRKRDGLVMICTIRDNVSMASYDKLSRWGVINRRTQADSGAAEGAGAGYPPAAARPVGPSAQRGEPAEAGAGEVADDPGQEF